MDNRDNGMPLQIFSNYSAVDIKIGSNDRPKVSRIHQETAAAPE